jgi:hypothetical protein
VELFYPVERLLGNPRVFYAVANYFNGPDGDSIKDAFFDLLEYGFGEYDDAEDCEFAATEVLFRMLDDGTFDIVLDSGISATMKPLEGETKAQITNDFEMAATSAIYQRIISAIEETNPEFSGNIVLCSPPTPGNAYLRSDDGERFEGSFHLLSDPDSQYAFTVEIIDVQRDVLQATYKPLQ